MVNLIARARRFIVMEDGPTTVEYAVLLALVILVCFAVVGRLGSTVSGVISTVNHSFGTSS